MGERVVFDPSAGRRDEPAKSAVPLDYGHADDPAAGAWRATAGVREQGDVIAKRLGGWRRVGFAFGLAFLFGAAVYGLSDPRNADPAAFFAGLGGLLIGFTVPVRGFDSKTAP